MTQPVVRAQRIVSPIAADSPGASWTNGWRIGNEVVMSGMTAHPASREAAVRGQPLGAYAQTLLILQKILGLVEAAGGCKANIVKTVVYLTDIADKDEVGRARKDFFEGVYPCSTLVEVKGLVFAELCVEIDAWARLDAILE